MLVDVTPRMEIAGAQRVVAFMAAHPDGFTSLQEASDVIAAYNPHRPRPANLDGLLKVLRQRDDGRYVGEIQFQLEFGGRRGDPFSQLYVDPDTLSVLAERAGWSVQIVERGENAAFLSVLRRSGGQVQSGVPCEAPQPEDG